MNESVSIISQRTASRHVRRLRRRIRRSRRILARIIRESCGLGDGRLFQGLFGGLFDRGRVPFLIDLGLDSTIEVEDLLH